MYECQSGQAECGSGMQTIPGSLLRANFLRTLGAKKIEVSPPLHLECRRTLPDRSDTLGTGGSIGLSSTKS